MLVQYIERIKKTVIFAWRGGENYGNFEWKPINPDPVKANYLYFSPWQRQDIF